MPKPKGGWKVPLRWWLLSAAKSRGKTLGEYVRGGRTRWFHVHEEMAFDMLHAQLESAMATLDKDPVLPGPPPIRKAKERRPAETEGASE